MAFRKGRLNTRCVLLIALAFAANAQGGNVLEGVPSVIDGDTIEIHGTKIRLHGIDAPESSQQCQRQDGKDWPCGRRSALALDEQIAHGTVRCEVTDTDRYGRSVAVCRKGTGDLNGWMVANGWAVAYTKYSDDYVTAETAAKAERRNIWAGTFVRPEEYRHAGNASSVAAVPKHTDCAIKGNISSGGKIYHLPGSIWYDKTQINEAAGERWFCSESEARAAGWRKAGSAAQPAWRLP